MKRFNWNIGIVIINTGYKLSTKTYGYQAINQDGSLRSSIAKLVLTFGYWLRG